MPLIIEIKVIPSSGRQKCTLEQDKSIKFYLKSTPKKGKANAELVKLLSKKLKIPQSDIFIITGTTCRKKKIKINQEISLEEFYQKMGIK